MRTYLYTRNADFSHIMLFTPFRFSQTYLYLQYFYYEPVTDNPLLHH